MKAICENCKWWTRFTDNKDVKVEQTYGRCHYYPPVADADEDSIARRNDFCSKFKEKEKEPEY